MVRLEAALQTTSNERLQTYWFIYSLLFIRPPYKMLDCSKTGAMPVLRDYPMVSPLQFKPLQQITILVLNEQLQFGGKPSPPMYIEAEKNNNAFISILVTLMSAPNEYKAESDNFTCKFSWVKTKNQG